MRKYGSDKPDLRNPIVMQNVYRAFLRGSGFKVFTQAARGGEERGAGRFPAPGGGQPHFSDRMNDWAQGEGAAGLGYILFFERAPEQRDVDRPTDRKGPTAA